MVDNNAFFTLDNNTLSMVDNNNAFSTANNNTLSMFDNNGFDPEKFRNGATFNVDNGMLKPRSKYIQPPTL